MKPKPNRFSPDELFRLLIQGDRVALGRAITLLESRRPDDLASKRRLMDLSLERTKNSVRIAITGMPGAGKSTLIESLGLYLIEKGKRVAVLAVDPTSDVSGGSILGDKTRMEGLGTRDEAFIRPSPNSGILGGVTEVTRETTFLCEAADYDVVLIETVGVGQAEFGVHRMVDFFLLVTIAGAGDELQGIKRGIMEMADAVLVNKSDGDRILSSKHTASDIRNALSMSTMDRDAWKPPVLTASALTGEGVDVLWDTITRFFDQEKKNGRFESRRASQMRHWFEESVQYHLRLKLSSDLELSKLRSRLLEQIDDGSTDPVSAATEFVQAALQSRD